MDITTTGLIEDIAALSRETVLHLAEEEFTSARKSTLYGTLYLRRIFAEKLWQGLASSENEYLMNVLKLKPASASKLLGILNHYVIEGGLNPERLLDVGQENLYQARKITEIKEKNELGEEITRPATVEEQLVLATVLSRTEIKMARNDQEITPHTPVWVKYCDVCKLSESTHT